MPRQNHESLHAHRTQHRLQKPTATLLHPLHQLTGIASVGPNQLQPGQLPANFLQDQLGTITILNGHIIYVYFLSALVHSNLRLNFRFLGRVLVTPRFHHWHHGIEREAIDVNFAVHFPVLDWIFGTYYLPADGRWPGGYGVANQPIPKGFFRQFLYPFVRRQAANPGPAAASAGNEGEGE